MSIIIDWDGQAIPEQLKQLPKGRYILASAEPPLLSQAEDDGLQAALDSMRAGRVSSAEDVCRRLVAKLNS